MPTFPPRAPQPLQATRSRRSLWQSLVIKREEKKETLWSDICVSDYTVKKEKKNTCYTLAGQTGPERVIIIKNVVAS